MSIDLPLSNNEIRERLRAVAPEVLLVSPRLLRRVIRTVEELPAFTLRVPHAKSYVVDRADLLDVTDATELEWDSSAPLPEQVILLERPSHQELVDIRPELILQRLWRLLLHGKVHCRFNRQRTEGLLSDEEIARRIDLLGPIVFDEIRHVLVAERMALRRDDASIYGEFVAVYLELNYFTPSLRTRYFPGIEDHERVSADLIAWFGGDELFAATCPADAALPDDRTGIDTWEDAYQVEIATEPPTGESGALPVVREPSSRQYRRWMERALREADRGNAVRSMVCKSWARRNADRRAAARLRTSIRNDIHRLLRRLQSALGLPEQDWQEWEEPLAALVDEAARSRWAVEARLLYDLQKVCVDHERGVHTVDLVEWALSFGRRPIQRALTNQRDVLMVKHLQSAERRLAAVRLPNELRQRLWKLVRLGIEHVEGRIRQEFRPRIRQALDEVGLLPANLPEAVARDRLMESLLDKLTERGFLKFVDLRDALSQSNLKLPDFGGAADLWYGDPLLKADRKLAVSLDGVYRRAELYLRWMQQLTSLGFGTTVGRIVTQYLAVPFGGAYVILAGLQHAAAAIMARLARGTGMVVPEPEIKTPATILLTGLLLFALLHFPDFRKEMVRGLSMAGQALRAVFLVVPRWIVHLPAVQQFLRSRAVRLALRYLARPTVVALALWILVPWRTTAPGGELWHLAVWFILANLVLNSRAGRNAEELVLDTLSESWHRFGLRILYGLFYAIVDLSRSALEATERVLYTVDEWLRFRTGENRWSVAVKGVLGTLWFFVTYVVRFCINLLIEPQINPIKHFPVVTVSHKLLLPFIPTLGAVLAQTMEKGLAYTLASVIITSIPGIFGFLVWELKENWRLFAANRPRGLRPVMIGQHGETMPRLLRPGFHSGTLPKRYAKLRSAERKARAKGIWKSVRKNLMALQEIERELRRFIEREGLALLDKSGHFGAHPPTLRDVRLATNQVRFDLEIGPAVGRLRFETKAGLLMAAFDLSRSGELSTEQRAALDLAIEGLYFSAATNLVPQRTLAELQRDDIRLDVSPEGLLLRPIDDPGTEARYAWTSDGPMTPQVIGRWSRRPLPVLERRQVWFDEQPMAWTDWLAAWKRVAQAPPTSPNPATDL